MSPQNIGKNIALGVAMLSTIILVFYFLIRTRTPSSSSSQQESLPSTYTTNFPALAGKWYTVDIDPFAGPYEIKPETSQDVVWFAKVIQIGGITNSITMTPSNRKVDWGNGVTNVWVMAPRDVDFMVKKRVR
jgi:hypothetical protein